MVPSELCIIHRLHDVMLSLYQNIRDLHFPLYFSQIQMLFLETNDKNCQYYHRVMINVSGIYVVSVTVYVMPLHHGF